jgi:hypothetical protein
MSQTYSCSHCGQMCETPGDTFRHIFSFHLHKDIGMGKAEAKVVLGHFEPYMPHEFDFYKN